MTVRYLPRVGGLVWWGCRCIMNPELAILLMITKSGSSWDGMDVGRLSAQV